MRTADPTAALEALRKRCFAAGISCDAEIDDALEALRRLGRAVALLRELAWYEHEVGAKAAEAGELLKSWGIDWENDSAVERHGNMTDALQPLPEDEAKLLREYGPDSCYPDDADSERQIDNGDLRGTVDADDIAGRETDSDTRRRSL